MKQMSLGTTGFERKTKRTRKRAFLDEMNLVVPWAELVALIAAHAPARSPKGGRPAFAVETMLRIHFLQQWFNLSDPAMEKQGTVVDATLIAAPSSTKNRDGARDPEMVSGDESEPRTTKKGNQWHFGMKAHIGVDAESGLVHTVVGTAANVHDITQAHALLHGQQTDVFADAGYRGVDKREEIKAQHPKVRWHIAMMPGKRKAMDKRTPMGAILGRLECARKPQQALPNGPRGLKRSRRGPDIAPRTRQDIAM